MRKLLSLVGAISVLGGTAFANSADVYVVNFRSDQSVESQNLDNELKTALSMVNENVEHVVIDTSSAAKWEKSAHEAFDREIVPVFNKWVGLPGFAAIIDAGTKQVIGCVNGEFNANEIAKEIQRMASQAQGQAYFSRTSFTKSTNCPAAHNKPL